MLRPSPWPASWSELHRGAETPATPKPERTALPNPPKRNPRRANGHRRNQVRAAVLAEEDVCWLCHRPVDKALPFGNEWSAEVDEVQPVSRGGSPFDRNNCRLSHRGCNRRRGNGLRQMQRRAVPPFTTAARPDTTDD